MGEILGLGLTHYPPLVGRDENMAGILRTILRDPGLPERYRDPANWPPPMRREYGDDGGTASAAAHRATLVRHFRHARKLLDDFRPEVVVIWGDDQYENFTEDIIPPFCILAYDRMQARHRTRDVETPNVWGEGADTVFRVAGHREAGKYLAARLLEDGVDTAYSYRPLHHAGLAHAFLNTIMFLDYDRVGFPYPVVAFQVNCYGRRVIAQRGYRSNLSQPIAEADLDPPSPSPKRCMQVGAATARAMRASPWRTALIASSSWSHAFLTDKHYQLYPDIEADRRLYEALRVGDYETWRTTPLESIEASGQQEMLNWYMLVGAMEELGRKPGACDFVETWSFNSNKCFAVFEP
ncbi:MAG: extradiol ring-cleavage dioxygenase [Candidatus Rokuibacteriota bacterium]|nr:MAG: extradiol ring-cleavage dioxygenase [Candidatus Rokubacteria bacterium]